MTSLSVSYLASMAKPAAPLGTSTCILDHMFEVWLRLHGQFKTQALVCEKQRM